ncbi:AraC family transcriptional regulator ligand-binding domain-containing protein [Nocardia sp. NPDC050697]|uniref:AraC family transcriptional regulator n=1 Tax=Nocardia sp. NPDC050697 TaxID=3155158 RepID=UPI0033EDD993
MDYVRSAAVRGLRAVVAELGGDAERYARSARLPVAVLDSDDVLVPARAIGELLELAAADLACADLGLRLAARQDLTMLGSLEVAVRNSPTLGDALRCTSRYLFVHARSLSLTIGDDPRGAGDVAGLYYGPATADGPRQGTDLGVAFIHRAIGYLHRADYGLLEVSLPYPPPAATRVYLDFFGAPVRACRNRGAAVLRIPRPVLDIELTAVSENLRRLALAFLTEQAAQRPAVAQRHDISGRVRSIIGRSLGTRTVDIVAVAGLLSLHHRTLQRRLEREGTTFAALVDEVRRDTAHRLLTTTDLPLGQVAGMVGYAEQSGFSRAARRWWDASAREVRARTAAAGRPPRPLSAEPEG